MSYDFQNDWIILKAKGIVPKEIVGFLEDVFQIMEIRERVGTIRGIKFEVRTREQNHNKPHVHAEYDKYAISIGIEDGEILAGNLPSSQERKAVRWVKDNKDYLLGKWVDIAVSATSITTKSQMG